MKTVSLFILVIFVVLLMSGSAFSTPQYPGVAVAGGDSQERSGAIQLIDGQAILKSIQPANPLSQSIQVLNQNAKKWKWELDPLSLPKFNLILAADIGKYRFTDRYLDLGNAEVSHYFILQEDYVFRTLNGRFDKIPAGFIWDGASIHKAFSATVLTVGNTRYNSAIAEGLIHDFMYRNPQRYTKDEADVLFFINLRRCNNPDPLLMYEGVYFGGFAYLQHMDKQRQGYYDVFTPEFYAENLKTFQEGNDSSWQKKRVDMNSLDRTNTSGDWDCCKCENPDDCDFYCKKCGKISKAFEPKADLEFLQFLNRGVRK